MMTSVLEKSSMTKSGSESSLSSINSNSSTGQLIKSLSTDKLSTTKTLDNHEDIKIPVAKSTDANKKKPIKFTVRKVSHEPIKSPVLETSDANNRQQFHYKTRMTSNTYTSKGNAPVKTKAIQQLEETQAKHDQYQSRILKITKEIDFLTNLLPPYNVEIDYATRTKITRAIEKLKMKQDEIEKKKYSLGMTISRLWRELDESDHFWVKQVSQ